MRGIRFVLRQQLNRLQEYTRRFNSQLVIVAVLVLSCLLFILIPPPKLNNPTCTVITAECGTLLGASIALDEQYRFPSSDSVPVRFKECILTFEDRYFFYHPGVNPFSIARAAWNNIKARRVVQGGSTVTMQVVRLSRRGKSRRFSEKVIEAILSFRLELSHSKRDILNLYASNAPFGGNVVGLNAAAWRYYGRPAHELSWAESAALAVLPNAPALVFPGKHPEALRNKRNGLLERLYHRGRIDSLTYSLSLLEPLPNAPAPLPQFAPHLLNRVISDGKRGQMVTTTINPSLQAQANDILDRHHQQLAGNQIHNAAVLVLDVTTNNCLVYIGNTKGEHHGNHVDVITAPRSTGSILKPFLYAAMLHDGLILPNTLVPDIPTQIGGYSPKNFHPEYDGAVPASRAISRSLNIPAVRLLKQYGVENFHHILRGIGLSTITRTPENYGLSLILGGAEATLWDLAGAYAAMVRDLNSFRPLQSRYRDNSYRSPNYNASSVCEESEKLLEHATLDASAIYFCFEAMREVSRPDEQAGWQFFSSSRSVAWKTGTSFGHRDAWAIGLNTNYVVAVWVGNASGEGRPNLTGVSAAAPILFDVFGILPPSAWFDPPLDDMSPIKVCRYSGYRASSVCTPTDTVLVPTKGLQTLACPYHHIIHLNQERTHRVTDRCMSVSTMVAEPWFILPPAMEWFYRSKNPFYRQLPPYLPGCEPTHTDNPMALLYPRIEGAVISIPRDLDGSITEAIFEVAHRRNDATIFWHLNDQYLGATEWSHTMALQPNEGAHLLTLVDDKGVIHETSFTVIGR